MQPLMKFLRITTCFTIVALLSGCGVAYMASESALLKSATLSDWGPEPPSNHWEIEEAFVRHQLKDPLSALFTRGSLSREAIPSAMTKAQLVWVTSLVVNAKNSYGGYTGGRTYYFAWRNGKLVGLKEPYISSYGVEHHYSWTNL
jgi:hypothetical protein